MLIWDMRNLSSRRSVLIAKLCQKWLTERASFSYHFYKLLRGRLFSLLSRNFDDILLKKKFDIRSWKYTYSNFHFGYIRRPIKAKTSCFDFIRSQNIPLSLSFQSQNVAWSALTPSYFQKCFIKIKLQTNLRLRPKSSGKSRESIHINPWISWSLKSFELNFKCVTILKFKLKIPEKKTILVIFGEKIQERVSG